jgi:signal transduction histidine kinase/ActR/RegA family two-component response regulator
MTTLPLQKRSLSFAVALAASALTGAALGRGSWAVATTACGAALAAALFCASRCLGGAVQSETDERRRLEGLVTERAAALERQRAELAEQMEAARAHLNVTDRLAAVGRLAGGVAHEVNSPLAVMLTNVSWVRETLRNRPPPKRTASGDELSMADILSALAEAEEGAQRVAQIVRDLQDFAGDGPHGPGAADLVQVVEHVRRLVGNEVRSRAAFRIEVPSGSLMVAGTPARLGQLLTHLFVHAARSIEEGHAAENEVRVVVRRDDAGSVEVEVRDTGRGLAPDALAHVFDPFFAAASTGQAEGVGLAVCHGLVGALGGEIAVDSAPGRGTVCRVRLHEAPSTARLALRAPAAAPARPRVLVVDDEPLVVASLYRVLSRQFDVVPHTSSRHALGLVNAGERFDAILLDLMMPELSGPAFFDEVTRLDPDLAPAVVFLTGGAFTPGAQEFLERVPNPRMGKPFDAAELVAVLEDRCAARAAAAADAAAAA